MKPRKVVAVVKRKRYDTEKAKLLASDAFHDGANWERHGRNQFLYRTRKGHFFLVTQTCVRGECDSLRPLDRDEAMTQYEQLPVREMPWEDAFPGVRVEDA